MNTEPSINWKNIKVVIFDVDGTLYDQSILRKKIFIKLLVHYTARPWKFKDLLILRDFRNAREKKAGIKVSDIENAQYQWCAEEGNYSISRVKEVVGTWIFNKPNSYLPNCIYPGTKNLFTLLKRKGFKIAIYSDYKADAKLKALNLPVDLIVSSTDSFIDKLKPDPTGLYYIAEKLKAKIGECLFIGDRPELDGQCAINAGMPYLIVDKKPWASFDFYTKITKDLFSQNETLS